MKRIVVYDIAASRGGGGETVLNQYFEHAHNTPQIEWWFFVSIAEYKKKQTPNIHVVFVEIRKKSAIETYVDRKKYELFEVKQAIHSINPDEVISLQNMVVPGVTCKQTVYLHQSFQFSPVKYRFTKKTERSLAFRQRIICQIIKKHLKKADKVIVQTKWMKKRVAEWANYPLNRIVVEPPKVSLPKLCEHIVPLKRVFIYPANAYLNKNHQVIIDACKILKSWGYMDYKILFTVSAEKMRSYEKLWNEIEENSLPIECVGHLEKNILFEKYQEYVTLFPSYIETFGLPLLESKYVGGRIIASDTPFSHEILDGYDKVTFVGWDNAKGWAEAIRKYIEEK